MTFSVNGIKQENNEQQAIDMLVCVDSLALARTVLEHNNILILSIKEYTQKKEEFGDIYFKIKAENQEVEIVTKHTDIQEACTFFSSAGFNITTINIYSKPITAREMAEIMNISKSIVEEVNKKAKLEVEKNKTQEKEYFTDQTLEQAKVVALRVFDKVDQTLNRSVGAISIIDLKKIKALTEDLKKLRMGSNLEKIKNSVTEILELIDRINTDRYATQPIPQDTIAPGSLITSIDVLQEIEKNESAQILKDLHAKIPIKQQDYAVLGISAIYAKFLQKDFLHVFKNPTGLLYNLYDLLEFIAIIVIAVLGIFTLFNQIYVISSYPLGLAFGLVTIGIWGFVIYFVRLRRRKNIFSLLFLIVVAIILHYFLMRLVTSNFAL